MTAFLVLLLAALSRLLPHAMHGVGINFTAVGAGLLFFGSRRPRWQASIAAAIMAVTDIYLTTQVYGLAFHVRDYALTWLWYGVVALLGGSLLRKISALRVASGVFASATGFFLISDLAVWMGTNMYPHTAAGLTDCFVKALPFYANDLASTAIVSAVLFGLPLAARYLAESLHSAQESKQPLA